MTWSRWIAVCGALALGCAGEPDSARVAAAPVPRPPAATTPEPVAATVSSELERLIAATAALDGVELRYATTAGRIDLTLWRRGLLLRQTSEEGVLETRLLDGRWTFIRRPQGEARSVGSVDFAARAARLRAAMRPHLKGEEPQQLENPRVEIDLEIALNARPGTDRPDLFRLNGYLRTLPGPTLGWLDTPHGGEVLEKVLRVQLEPDSPTVMEISRESGILVRMTKGETEVITLLEHRTGVPLDLALLATPEGGELIPDPFGDIGLVGDFTIEEQIDLARDTAAPLVRRTHSRIREAWAVGASGRLGADERAFAAFRTLITWQIDGYLQIARQFTTRNLGVLAQVIEQRLQSGQLLAGSPELHAGVEKSRAALTRMMAADREEWLNGFRLEHADANSQLPSELKAIHDQAAQAAFDEWYIAFVWKFWQHAIGKHGKK